MSITWKRKNKLKDKKYIRIIFLKNSLKYKIQPENDLIDLSSTATKGNIHFYLILLYLEFYFIWITICGLAVWIYRWLWRLLPKLWSRT